MSREEKLEKALCEIFVLSHWLNPDYAVLFESAQRIAGKALDTTIETYYKQYGERIAKLEGAKR